MVNHKELVEGEKKSLFCSGQKMAVLLCLLFSSAVWAQFFLYAKNRSKGTVVDGRQTNIARFYWGIYTVLLIDSP